jgi:serine/threonine-protein kinase RsbW
LETPTKRASTLGETRLEIRLAATPDAVASVRRDVAAFAAAHGVAQPDDVALAVSEAVTNVVMHAYRNGLGGQVRVVACGRATEFVVVVRDYGCGMRPHPESPGAGLGLSIIGATASELNIERPDDGGTRIRLRFPRLASAAA